MNKNTTEPVCGRELPGFCKKSFVLYFGGGEIWFEHLDGIYQYTELTLEKLCADSEFFCRPSAPSYIAFVLNETYVTDELILTIAEKLKNSGKRFMRVAFVGAKWKTKNKLKKCLKNNGFAIDFFSGIESAKEWLIDRWKNNRRLNKSRAIINCIKNQSKQYKACSDVVAVIGFEPMTPRVWTVCSSQLSYTAVTTGFIIH